MIEAAVKASPRPVTIKIRTGFTHSCINAVEMAHVAQESGASAITVHGRTRDQYYTGTANWDIITAVKRAVKIPVIGNGDLFTPEIIVSRLSESGCDGVMIARGALGNPWLFSRTLTYMETGVLPPLPDRETVLETAVRHLRAVAADNGGRVEEMRKHLSWYTKGMPGSAAMRRKINLAHSVAEMEELLYCEPDSPDLETWSKEGNAHEK
jgi:nifR3 family TIM-barrel protein